MSIKAIGFDHSGVIGGPKKGYLSYIDEVCKILNVGKATYFDVYFSLNDLINTGKVESWHKFAPILLAKLDRLDKLRDFNHLADRMEQEQLKIDHEMLELVDKLRSNGYKVGLLSNNTREIGNRLRDLDLDKHFDVFQISANVGVQKPDPKSFALFTSILGVEMNELVFIDDSHKSLSTATECGYTPILFENIGKLKVALKSLGITY